MFFRCQVQYRRRYVDQDVMPPLGFNLPRGKSIHYAGQKNNEQKIETHEDLPIKEIKDIAAESFEYNVEKDGIELSSEDKKIGRKKLHAENKDIAVNLAELWGKQAAPLIQPKMVEERLRITLNDEIDLLGILDTIDDKNAVIDTKSSSKKMYQAQIDNSIQMTIYSLTFRALFGKEPSAIFIDNLIHKKKEDEFNRLQTVRTTEDYKVLINRINIFLKALKTGIFTPAPQDAWHCDERYCGYATTCKYYRKR